MPKQKKVQIVVPVRTTKNKIKKKSTAEKRELTRLGWALRSLGGLAGASAGALVGAPSAGSSLGTNLGATLSRWLGSGDYTVKSNSLLHMNASDSIPAMHSNAQSVTIRHKEFLGQLKSSQAFSVMSVLELNPGLPYTFPWLSTIASKFQEYQIKGAVFHYVPTSGYAVSSTNPALGSIMIQTSYRSNDSAPSSKLEMLNEYWSSEGSPSEAFCHPIECNPSETVLSSRYVRNTAVPATESQLFYDLGVTYVAVQGQQADGNVLGDLWLTYDIVLRKPIMRSSVADNAIDGLITFGTGSTTAYTSPTYPFGTHGYSFDVATGTFTFPKGAAGIYRLNLIIKFTSSATASGFSALTSPANCTTSVIATSTGAGCSVAYIEYQVIIPDPALQASFVFPAYSAPNNITFMELTSARLSSVV